MKTLKTCLVILCLLCVRTVGLPQCCGANSFMKEIILDRGKTGLIAIVDEADFEELNRFRWRSKKAHKCENLFYAVRTSLKTESIKKTAILMHRQILKLTDKTVIVDHKNRNGLDNQRCNLRTCTISQNNANRSAMPNKTSSFLGVCYNHDRKKWLAAISSNNQTRIIGRFNTEIEAAIAYNNKAKELHGEFANLNAI